MDRWMDGWIAAPSYLIEFRSNRSKAHELVYLPSDMTI
jgi:hypothetical protein